MPGLLRSLLVVDKGIMNCRCSAARGAGTCLTLVQSRNTCTWCGKPRRFQDSREGALTVRIYASCRAMAS